MLTPRNGLVYVRRISEEKTTANGIIIPEDRKKDRFIKLEVLNYSEYSKDLAIGKIILAEDMFEPCMKEDPTVGLIHDKYIVAIE